MPRPLMSALGSVCGQQDRRHGQQRRPGHPSGPMAWLLPAGPAAARRDVPGRGRAGVTAGKAAHATSWISPRCHPEGPFGPGAPQAAPWSQTIMIGTPIT
jgi:hypothetical protein